MEDKQKEDEGGREKEKGRIKAGEMEEMAKREGKGRRKDEKREAVWKGEKREAKGRSIGGGGEEVRREEAKKGKITIKK